MSHMINVERIKKNVDIILELKKDQPNMELLKSYSGWGGLRDGMYTPSIYHAIKNTMSDDELSSIKKTFRSAYYTPANLVNFIYKVLDKLNCQPKRILEPSAGSGAFIEHMPHMMRSNAEIHAVETDNISCQLLSSLYPDLHIHRLGFEQFNHGNFDLIIGNPPYGQIYLKDRCHSDLTQFSIHHYFVAKSMRLLNNNGLLAMVVPRYFLDNPKKHVREIIAKEGGSLIAAFRLPDNLFQDAKVTVDIVILRKSAIGSDEWLTVRQVGSGKKSAYLNNYFFSHKNHVRGKLKFINVYGRTEISCKQIIT